MSLSDKLAELTLDISDKKKTVELLTTLISQQQGRHALEAANYEKEMEESLKKVASDNDVTVRDLFKTNEQLTLKKNALEARVEDLVVEKQVSQPFCHLDALAYTCLRSQHFK